MSDTMIDAMLIEAAYLENNNYISDNAMMLFHLLSILKMAGGIGMAGVKVSTV